MRYGLMKWTATEIANAAVPVGDGRINLSIAIDGDLRSDPVNHL